MYKTIRRERQRMKIVLIGAGSSSFGRGQIVDVLRAPALQGPEVTLALVDTDSVALNRMHRFAHRVAEHLHSRAHVTSQVERCEALADADYVLIAVCRHRQELWEQDFRVPLAYGFRHCLGENGGPGALFHALRSFELVVPICRDVETMCPGAVVLNFTNPEARVLHAVSHLTRVRAFGICHGVTMGIDYIARLLNRPVSQLEVTAAGVNHFYAVLSVVDRATNVDLLDTCKTLAAADTDPHLRLFRTILNTFGVFTFPSDDHVGEYLSYGSEYSGVKWPYGIESRPVGPLATPPWAVSAAQLEAYASGAQALDGHALAGSGELSVPIITDIAAGRTGRHAAVNVLNTDGFVENLPRSGIVEVPAIADGEGIHPQAVGCLPEPFAALLRTQYAIHDTLTEAYHTRSKRLLLEALLLDPVVSSVVNARQLLDDMLRLQQAYLPRFD
jgi:alpha-galactosidase